MSERLSVAGILAKDNINGNTHFGGSAGIIASAAHELGLKVQVVSVLGQDTFSGRYRQYLDGIGVDTSDVSGVLTTIPQCEVRTSPDAHGSSWMDNDCHPALRELDVDPGMFKSTDFVHIACCPPELARKISENCEHFSYEPGPVLVFDSNFFDDEAARKSTFIFLNQAEAEAAKEYLDRISQLPGDYPRLRAVIITQAENGVVVREYGPAQESENHFPAQLVPQIVDPTGAGDNFKAGFLAGYLKGRELYECIQIGIEMGAACVVQEGGILQAESIRAIRQKHRL